MNDDHHTRIMAALKTANDRVSGFIGYYEMADAVIEEQQMHHKEAIDWIDALHCWIRRQGLEVPSWENVDD